MQLRNITVVVRDLEVATRMFTALGHCVAPQRWSASWRAMSREVACGPATVHLLSPTSGEGAVARRLAGRGPGLHSLLFDVVDAPGFASILRERGVESAPNGDQFWLDPRQTHGALVGFMSDGADATTASGPQMTRVGWLVREIDEARDFLSRVEFSTHPASLDDDVDALFAHIDVVPVPILLVSPAFGGPFAQELETRGVGLHHIQFQVPRLEAALQSLQQAGFAVSSDAEGPEGGRRWLVDPTDLGFVVELVG